MNKFLYCKHVQSHVLQFLTKQIIERRFSFYYHFIFIFSFRFFLIHFFFQSQHWTHLFYPWNENSTFFFIFNNISIAQQMSVHWSFFIIILFIIIFRISYWTFFILFFVHYLFKTYSIDGRALSSFTIFSSHQVYSSVAEMQNIFCILLFVNSYNTISRRDMTK